MKQTTLSVTSNGILITPRIQKYLNIINSGTITENELIALKSFINSNKDAYTVLSTAIWANEDGLKLTPEQNKKGYDFLMDCWKTPRNVERKNNPFSYREQDILENFAHFTLKGFYDAGNSYRSYYLPLYECHSNDNSFEYYYNGKVNIIG